MSLDRLQNVRMALSGDEQLVHGDRRERTERLIRRCLDAGCRSLLDIGCDGGHFTRYARSIALHAVGVDWAPYVAVSVMVDAEKLPLRTRTFDVCLATELLEHLEEPLEALDYIRRVARRYVIVSVPGAKAGWGGARAQDPDRMERIDYRTHAWYIPKMVLERHLNVCMDLSVPTRTILMSDEGIL